MRNERERQWQIWKTIELGTGLRTPKAFYEAFGRGGFKFEEGTGAWASGMIFMNDFRVATKKRVIELINVSAKELGFEDNGPLWQTTLKDIYTRGQKMGLQLCPSEVGPQLRLQYGDQPVGEGLWIAMKPIDSGGIGPRVFGVVHYYSGSGLYLISNSGSPDRLWPAHSRWVFTLRK